MKKIFTLIVTVLVASTLTQAQVLLVKWTFPTGTSSDSIADGGLTVNLDKTIHTEGGTSAIDFSKNGATTKAAQATGWDNGSMLKCWVVELNSQGYENLKLSSKMQSGGNNPGPRDYMVQYRVGNTGNWTDVPGTNITVINDWTTGIIDSVALPSSCNGQASLFLRWIMTSNTNSQGGDVTSSGINKIDDIYVIGKVVTTGLINPPTDFSFKVFPNPSTGLLIIEASEPIAFVSVFNSGGKCVFKQACHFKKRLNLNLDTIVRGTYFLKLQMVNGSEKNERVVLL